ncbi:hypothetical protein R3P38DRAFT_1451041 [Favolaschia claudopus]|uniref:Uncharacterized protein n=1 Tax=Favolaschia claudopus TaxID=2862362 RepID=A0AAW0AN60_9AGAR
MVSRHSPKFLLSVFEFVLWLDFGVSSVESSHRNSLSIRLSIQAAPTHPDFVNQIQRIISSIYDRCFWPMPLIIVEKPHLRLRCVLAICKEDDILDLVS